VGQHSTSIGQQRVSPGDHHRSSRQSPRSTTGTATGRPGDRIMGRLVRSRFHNKRTYSLLYLPHYLLDFSQIFSQIHLYFVVLTSLSLGLLPRLHDMVVIYIYRRVDVRLPLNSGGGRRLGTLDKFAACDLPFLRYTARSIPALRSAPRAIAATIPATSLPNPAEVLTLRQTVDLMWRIRGRENGPIDRFARALLSWTGRLSTPDESADKLRTGARVGP
jgi:hypothetical protein